MGTLGVAAGIASGDASKVLQYGVTAGTLGGQFTKGLGDKLSSDRYNLTKGGLEAFKEGYYGDTYAKDKYIKDKKRSSEFDDYLYNHGLYDKAKRQDFKENYLDYFIREGGLTDNEDLLTAYKLAKENNTTGMSDYEKKRQAAAEVKMANRWGDISNSPDLEKKWREQFSNKIYNYDSTINDAHEQARLELGTTPEQVEELKRQYTEHQEEVRNAEEAMRIKEEEMIEAEKKVSWESNAKKKNKLKVEYEKIRQEYQNRKDTYTTKNDENSERKSAIDRYNQTFEKHRNNITQNQVDELAARVKNVHQVKKTI